MATARLRNQRVNIHITVKLIMKSFPNRFKIFVTKITVLSKFLKILVKSRRFLHASYNGLDNKLLGLSYKTLLTSLKSCSEECEGIVWWFSIFHDFETITYTCNHLNYKNWKSISEELHLVINFPFKLLFCSDHNLI